MITPEQMHDMKRYIRDNLKKIRRSQCLTPYGLAKQCNLGADTITRIESGKMPTMLTTYKLIDALQLTINH